MKRDNISKNELSKIIYSNLGIPITFSRKILDIILETIVEGLNKNEVVKIAGFGKFKVRKKRKRTGRNPMTKKEYEIKSRKVVTFHPSIPLKEILNGKK